MTGIAWRDILFFWIIAFLLMVMFMMSKIADPAKMSEEQTTPPGNLIVAITWPKGDTDVDMWVDGPGEMNPVGYSNKGGLLWNLLRDDLGNQPDATDLNYENAYTRGIIPGEYTVNVHCFRCPQVPIPVQVEVSASKGNGKSAVRQIAAAKVELRQNGQERTAIRFVLKADGSSDPKTFSSVFKPLRSGTKQ